jgi:hypothetical protein
MFASSCKPVLKGPSLVLSALYWDWSAAVLKLVAGGGRFREGPLALPLPFPVGALMGSAFLKCDATCSGHQDLLCFRLIISQH